MKISQLPKTRQHMKLILAALIVISGFTLLFVLLALSASRNSGVSEAAATSTPAVCASASVAPSPTLLPTAAPAEEIKTTLRLSSAENDLTVTVCGEDGSPITGVKFTLTVRYPDGRAERLDTDQSGTLYLQGLSQGEYAVSLSSGEGYSGSPEAKCTVRERLEYKPLANVSATTEVLTVSEIPVNETMPAPIVSQALVIEEISTSQTVTETTGGSIAVEGSGESTKSYTYDYHVGTSGFLLRADGTESDVQPVEENGVLSYGIRRVISYYAADGTALTSKPRTGIQDVDYFAEEASQKVNVIISPGVPDSGYAISAREVSQPASKTGGGVRTGWLDEAGKRYYYDRSGLPVTGLKRIDGRLFFFDGAGVQRGTLGIDVSYFNGAIDWSGVKASGIEYALVRVAGRTWGSGKLFEDENSYTQGANGGYYLQQAKAAGLKVGAYVYSNAVNTNEAVEEASLAVEVLRKAGVALDFPVYLDLEYSGDYPAGRADRLTAAERGEIITAFCTTIENSGFGAGVYVGDNFLKSAIDEASLSPYSVWYANYTNNYALPKFTGYNIWQFTASGVVSGISGSTDMNIIFN